jgi:hypothetical protein
MIKKIIFLIIPLVFVYWRSTMAQNATRWLFRGVIPTDGPLGQVIQAGNRSNQSQQRSDDDIQTPSARRSIAAWLAAQWALVLAFLAGVLVAAWAFSFGAGQN